jgi:hypothetical protein
VESKVTIESERIAALHSELAADIRDFAVLPLRGRLRRFGRD